MKEDIINPKRYTGNKLECWDFWIEAGLNPLVASAVKYVWRYRDKNGKQDLQKSLVFLDKMLNVSEESLYFTETNLFVNDERLNNMSELQRYIINISVQTTQRDLYRVAISDMELAIKHLIKIEYGELSD